MTHCNCLATINFKGSRRRRCYLVLCLHCTSGFPLALLHISTVWSLISKLYTMMLSALQIHWPAMRQQKNQTKIYIGKWVNPRERGGRELCKGEKQQTTREREHLKIYEQRPQSSALCGMPKRNKRAFIMPHGAGAAANPACVCMLVPLCVM